MCLFVFLCDTSYPDPFILFYLSCSSITVLLLLNYILSPLPHLWAAGCLVANRKIIFHVKCLDSGPSSPMSPPCSSVSEQDCKFQPASRVPLLLLGGKWITGVPGDQHTILLKTPMLKVYTTYCSFKWLTCFLATFYSAISQVFLCRLGQAHIKSQATEVQVHFQV